MMTSNIPVQRDYLAALERNASLGGMTRAMIHDLASIVQGMQCAMDEIAYLVGDDAPHSAELRSAVAMGSEMSERVVALFRSTSALLRTRDVAGSPTPADLVVERACAVSRAYVHTRANLKVSVVPEVAVEIGEALILQVLINVLRNAADASPPNGVIDLEVIDDGAHVKFRVTDDGPGLSPEIASGMFERDLDCDSPNAFSLAIGAGILTTSGGGLNYRRAPGRGAEFELSVPKYLQSPNRITPEVNS